MSLSTSDTNNKEAAVSSTSSPVLTSSFSSSPTPPSTSTAQKTNREEDKRKNDLKLEEWAATLKFSDVIFDETGSSIKTIAGLTLDKFKGKMLIKFCRAIPLIVPNKKSSKACCIQHLLNYKRNGPAREKVAAAIRPKSKETRPRVVTKEGTFILTITDPSTRKAYQETFQQRSRADLDKGGLAYKEQWTTLVTMYNDVLCDDLDSLGLGEDDQKYIIYGAADGEPSDYDVLDEQSMSDVVAHINWHYEKARRNKNVSGQHLPFKKFVPQNKGWLLFYHEKLEETGNRNLMDAAYAQLPSDVFLASSTKEHKPASTKSTSTSPGTSGCNKRKLAEARRAALESVDKRNIIYSKAATLELNTILEKRYEELDETIFNLNTKLRSIKQELKEFGQSVILDEQSKIKLKGLKGSKKHLEKKISRAMRSLESLKKELNYNDSPDESSFESDN